MCYFTYSSPPHTVPTTIQIIFKLIPNPFHSSLNISVWDKVLRIFFSFSDCKAWYVPIYIISYYYIEASSSSLMFSYLLCSPSLYTLAASLDLFLLRARTSHHTSQWELITLIWLPPHVTLPHTFLLEALSSFSPSGTWMTVTRHSLRALLFWLTLHPSVSLSSSLLPPFSLFPLETLMMHAGREGEQQKNFVSHKQRTLNCQLTKASSFLV